MKYVLIGFMGAGKTTVARMLAEELKLPLVEMDDLILERSGHNSINEIFKQEGEAAFRKLEQQVAASLAAASDIVISTGGGAGADPDNVDQLRSNGGRIIYLAASFSELSGRLKNCTDRPLFTEPDKALALYTARAVLYRKHADLIVDTDGRSCSGVLEQIVLWIKENKSD